ncbi:hypothetical protein P4O66_004556 [Electrophorus voltai]|uniref:Uncharacterized protein n=1 Tax=Electrophorus voltai TaxID=2609070 RepID=A0AAD8ZMP5_9TELE|nr:hypothetical protein P4O66_004556 [Electrophorus voltai]
MGSDREDPHGIFPPTATPKAQSEEPPVSKAPPRACHPGASRLPWVASREASSAEGDTLPPKAKSPRAHAPMPKPRGRKKAAAPVPAPEPGNTAGALPDTHAPKPGQLPLSNMAKDTPHKANTGMCSVSHSFLTISLLLTSGTPLP